MFYEKEKKSQSEEIRIPIIIPYGTRSITHSICIYNRSKENQILVGIKYEDRFCSSLHQMGRRIMHSGDTHTHFANFDLPNDFWLKFAQEKA